MLSHNFEQNTQRDLDRLQKADNYILRHLALHLYEAGQYDRLYQLLVGNKAWMEAKFARLNDDRAYVEDLELAISSFADPLVPEHVLPLIQLQTARRGVYQRADIYTDIDLKTLIWLGHAHRAASYARLRAKIEARFTGILIVYETLAEMGIKDIALLQEARDIAKAYPNYPADINRDSALLRVITAFAQAEYFSEAIDTYSTLIYENNTMSAKCEISAELARAGYFNDAFEVLNYTERSWYSRGLFRIAIALPKAGFFDEALATAERLKEHLASYTVVRREIAAALFRAGRIREAEILFTKGNRSATECGLLKD